MYQTFIKTNTMVQWLRPFKRNVGSLPISAKPSSPRGLKFLVAIVLFAFCAFTSTTMGQTWQIGSPTPNNVTATLNNGTLTITGTGKMRDWGWEGERPPWYGVKDNITNVIINNGVTTIGNDAFYFCGNLTSLTLPNSMMIIGDYTFSDCVSLTSITIPSNVTSIGNYAFQITGLREIHIENPVPPSVGFACFWAVNQSTCKLYVPQGTQISYAAIIDWCFFDIVGCDDSCYDIYVQESEHIRLEIHRQLVSITSEQLAAWLSNLDRVYEAYADLIGHTPNEGNKIVIQSVGPEIRAWARGEVGGNHIYWNSSYVSETLNAFVNDGDWSFGILHEMGHNFDKASEPNWGFQLEITANFKAFYVLDVIPECKYDLRGLKYSLQEMYDDIYAWSVQDDGDDDRFGDKITLGVFNVARKYGWGVLKQTFRSYWDNSYPYSGFLCNDAQKYNKFIDRLQYFSGSADIRSECFDVNNWLETIERHYSNNSICQWEIGYPTPADVIASFENGMLTIGGTGAMQNWWYNHTSLPWYCVKDEVTIVIINSGVTTIGDDAFLDFISLASVTIPNTVTTIGEHAFQGCSSLTEIHVNNPVPPSCGDWCFGWGVDKATCKLYVPQGSIDLYKAANEWKDFFNVLLGIDDVVANQMNIFPNPAENEIFIQSDLPIMKVEIYSLTGTLMMVENNFNEKISVSALLQGIYLLRVYTDEGLTTIKIVKR